MINNKRRIYISKPILLIALLAFLFVACANASMDEVTSMGGEAAPMAPEADMVRVDGQAFEPSAQSANIPVERLIIRTGELSIVVEDTEETLASISALTDEMGGWVVESSVSQIQEAKRGSISLRIPAERFDEMLTLVKESAVVVERESTSGQDVTEEYVDASARLENLEATADRVRSFLDEAQTVEEALAVNVELSRLEGEIESLKGRLQYLSQSAAFSTLYISVTPEVLNPSIQVGGWRPQGVARDAVEALFAALQGLGSLVIWLLIFVLPILLLTLVPLYLLVRFIRGRRLRRTSTS